MGIFQFGQFSQLIYNRQMALDMGIVMTIVADQVVKVSAVSFIAPTHEGAPFAAPQTVLAERSLAVIAETAGGGGNTVAFLAPDYR